MLLLLGGVLKELLRNRSRGDPRGGEVVTLVAENADKLRREHLVEDGDYPLAIGTVRFGDRPTFDVGARARIVSMSVKNSRVWLPSPEDPLVR
jgi:hypothetical protein